MRPPTLLSLEPTYSDSAALGGHFMGDSRLLKRGAQIGGAASLAFLTEEHGHQLFSGSEVSKFRSDIQVKASCGSIEQLSYVSCRKKALVDEFPQERSRDGCGRAAGSSVGHGGASLQRFFGPTLGGARWTHKS
jgi:hypothetical protein